MIELEKKLFYIYGGAYFAGSAKMTQKVCRGLSKSSMLAHYRLIIFLQHYVVLWQLIYI